MTQLLRIINNIFCNVSSLSTTYQNLTHTSFYEAPSCAEHQHGFLFGTTFSRRSGVC